MKKIPVGTQGIELYGLPWYAKNGVAGHTGCRIRCVTPFRWSCGTWHRIPPGARYPLFIGYGNLRFDFRSREL